MAINLKTATPDTTFPTSGYIIGADSQGASDPSIYDASAVLQTFLGSTSFTGSTVTSSSPLLNLAQTWNNAGVTFTGLKFNVTDTASNASSLLMDLQVGGASQATVTKSGVIGVKGLAPVTGSTISIAANIAFTGGSNLGFDFNIFTGSTTVTSARALMGNGLIVGSAYDYKFSSTSSANGSPDLFLTRRGAANLRLGAADAASPIAQTLSVQSVAAGQTNVAGANFTITGSQGTGSGAGGSIIFQVAPAGSSGTAQNALATALTIAGNRNATFEAELAALSSLRASGGFLYLGTNVNGYVRNIDNTTWSFIGGIQSVTSLGLTSGVTTSADVILARDAANTLALRNGTNAQAFRVYNTTDGTNSEFGSIKWNSNVLEIASEIAGTGTRRPIAMVGGIGPYTLFKTTSYGAYIRQIASSYGLNLYDSDANAQNAANIGRNGYLEGTVGICLSSSFEIKFSSGADAAISHDSGIARTAAGVLRLTNASTGGGALQLTEMTAPAAPATNNVRIYAEDDGSGNTQASLLFSGSETYKFRSNGFMAIGGTTSSFPALKRSSTTLQARLADDSAFGTIQGKIQTDANAVSESISPTHTLTLYDAAGNAYKVPCVAA